MRATTPEMAESTRHLEQRVKMAQRLLYYKEAHDDLPKFIHVMMPDEENPDDITRSAYQRTGHGNLLCSLIAELEAGTRSRTAISIAPQHGKTLHLSTMGPAWILGRNPKARIVVATYNETRAGELGEDFRRLIESELFKAVFPGVELATGSKSKTMMRTTSGGRISFVGLGGTVTGRTADYFIIDDPMKDDEELQLPLFRDKMWKWFFSVAYSRGSKRTRIIVLHTRWHTDDLIGRLCDPNHPDRRKDPRLARIAKDWVYLNIPGVVKDKRLAGMLGLKLAVPTDPDIVEAFGQDPICALWEEDKDLRFFAQWKRGDPRSFSALVLGAPTIEDGEYFNVAGLIEYASPTDLPASLKVYGASDHAVSEKQYRDLNCIGCVGIDEDDNIWVLPDVVWKQMTTDKVVEELLFQFKQHQPLLWGMESELISKSFGPFLYKRMHEERIYTPILEIPTTHDKQRKARSIQGRIAMGKVRFPKFAPWWPEAKAQVLQFPYGAHDDFVDWLSDIGQMLLSEYSPVAATANDNRPSPNSLQGIFSRIQRNAGAAVREKATESGW